MRHIPNTRLYLPEPALAWVIIVVGVILIAVGTAAAVRVRAHMWGETRSILGALISFNRDTLHYWFHDYDEADKWLLGLAMIIRFPVAFAILWAIAGLAWT